MPVYQLERESDESMSSPKVHCIPSFAEDLFLRDYDLKRCWLQWELQQNKQTNNKKNNQSSMMKASELWQVLNTRSSAASQEIELWAPCVGNRMHFLLGNLFCALPRKSSGKKDAQGCRAGKEMVALQLGEAGQTHSCQHKVRNSKFWMTTKYE